MLAWAMPRETVTLELRPDHLERIAHASPVTAVAELIWNALDADAKEVEVSFDKNVMDRVSLVRVSDDGHGMSFESAKQEFSRLGGSWKRTATRSRQDGRVLHGRNGEGRFKALALGETIRWTTTASRNGNVLSSTMISLRHGSLVNSEVESLEPDSPPSATGTVVEATLVRERVDELLSDQAFERLSVEFGPYLTRYPDVRIVIASRTISASQLIVQSTSIDLPPIKTPSGESVTAGLRIIEWTIPRARGLHLCDSQGFTLLDTRLGVHTPDLSLSAHISSSYLEQMYLQNELDLWEMDPTAVSLIGSARSELRTYVRERRAQQALGRVATWKKDKIYPFEEPEVQAQSTTQRVRRQVFDIVAVTVEDNLPQFSESSLENRRLQFWLLRQAIDSGPESLLQVLEKVVRLPEERIKEFAALLEYTPLSAVITASKTVADRMRFLRDFRELVYGPNSDDVLERTQLHRILAHEVWLFGEHYTAYVDDRDLTEALMMALEADREDFRSVERVVRADGKRGIIDLMLARAFRPGSTTRQQNLVIELKRPSRRIDLKAMNQVQEYAHALSSHALFPAENHTWDFWVVSSKIDQVVRDSAEQPNRPPGLYSEAQQYRIWVRTWAELIEDARARLDFVSSRLDLQLTHEPILSYLMERYEQYLPGASKASPPTYGSDASSSPQDPDYSEDDS